MPRQATLTPGFWMSFHELINGYPWMTKRTARVLDPAAAVPARNGSPGCSPCSCPTPAAAAAARHRRRRAVIGVLAAVALPAYQDYRPAPVSRGAYLGSEPVRQALGAWYVQHKEAPGSLQEAGLPTTLADGSTLSSTPSRWCSRSRRRTASWCSRPRKRRRQRHLALRGRRRRARGAAADAVPRGRRRGGEEPRRRTRAARENDRSPSPRTPP